MIKPKIGDMVTLYGGKGVVVEENKTFEGLLRVKFLPKFLPVSRMFYWIDDDFSAYSWGGYRQNDIGLIKRAPLKPLLYKDLL